MTLAEEFDRNLISPNDAIELVCAHVGTKFQARRLIADAIHSGDVVIYAEKIYTIEDGDPTDEWADLVKSSEFWGEIAEVQGELWDDSYLWPEEVRYWDWDRGNFVLNQSADLAYSFDGILFEGVMLERKAVAALVGQGPRSGLGGRRVDSGRWADFWVALIKQMQAEPAAFTAIKSKAELSSYMLSASDELFSANAIRPAVDRVWTQLLEPLK